MQFRGWRKGWAVVIYGSVWPAFFGKVADHSPGNKDDDVRGSIPVTLEDGQPLVFETELRATMLAVPHLLSSLDMFCSKSGLHDPDRFAVLLVIDELVTNSISHGYVGEPGPVRVAVRISPDTVEVRYSDDAPEFDPTLRQDPDIEQGVEARPIGGLGLYMARKMVDSMTYSRQADANVLEMKRVRHEKTLSRAAEEPQP